ncbi:sulfur carrier protein ThiS [Betaproteobacteria bacterium]|nr:sulfur carrier protein ThiS [Betaproteobacteria bacterium]
MVVVDEEITLEDFLNNQKVDTRNLATSVNADLILKDKRKDKVLKENDQINIFGPITGG